MEEIKFFRFGCVNVGDPPNLLSSLPVVPDTFGEYLSRAGEQVDGLEQCFFELLRLMKLAFVKLVIVRGIPTFL